MREELYAKIRQAMSGDFDMKLAGSDAQVAVRVVNTHPIDAHLEACFTKGRDTYEWEGRKLSCVVSPESMPVLLRRLFEDDTPEGDSLAMAILGSLGFDEGEVDSIHMGLLSL